MTNKISFLCIQIIVLLTPLAFYTGTKDNFLIKDLVFSFYGLILALLLILKMFEKRQQLKSNIFKNTKNTWLGFPLVLYLLAIILSIINAVHSQLVYEFLLFWVILTSIYFTVRRFPEKYSMAVLNVLIIVTFIANIYGLLQYLGFDIINWLSNFSGRPFSTFGNPNFFSGYLLLVFPLIFTKMISTRKPLVHIFWMIFCFLIVFNIWLARTRGAWIAFLISIACLIIWQMIYTRIKFAASRRMFRGTFWFSLLFSAMVIISISKYDSIKSFVGEIINTETKDSSVNERIFKWKTGWEMIKDHPVLGIGAGNLKVNFANYQAKVKRDIQIQSTSESNLHNEFLQRFAETGIFGLAAFLFIFFSFFYYSVELLYQKIKSDESRFNMLLGLFTGVFSVFIYALTNFPFSIVPVVSAMFVFFGIMESYVPRVSLVGESKEKYLQHISKSHLNPIIHVILLIIFVILLYKIVIPQFASDVYRKKGDNALFANDFQGAITDYEKAIKMDYYHSERTAYDLGEAYRKLNLIDKAIESYNISIALRNYGEVYNNIGNCYYLKKDRRNALKYWNIAADLGLPDNKLQEQLLKNLKILNSMK
ncbi:MAG: O-antigen ligase family protein [Elusimicrobia bacterium]|nr:O-antigen ligase family protein [Elusimicrobiota bacterium]